MTRMPKCLCMAGYGLGKSDLIFGSVINLIYLTGPGI